MAIVVSGLLILDRSAFLQVDYGLLFTFVFFFIFAGNMGRIDAVRDFFSHLLNINTLIFSALSCQVISNVPAALLLSGFTDSYNKLIIGTNLGGLGTLIASMASLISFKQVAVQYPASKKYYLVLFTVWNIIFLVVLSALAFLLDSI
jgi:hypothetical protein